MGKDDAEKQWYSDLSRLLETEFGKRAMWKMMETTDVFQSVTKDVPGLMPKERLLYNAGRQDVGHWLMGQMTKANPKAVQFMIAEAYERKLEGERKRKEETDEDPA